MLISELFINDPVKRHTAFSWISRITVFLFAAFVGYDIQVLKENAKLCRGNPDYVKESVGLYLDILNLFTGFGGMEN